MKFKTKLKIGLGTTGLAIIVSGIIGLNALQSRISMPNPEHMLKEWSYVTKQAIEIQKTNPDYKGPITITNNSNDNLKYDKPEPVKDELSDKIEYYNP